MANVDCFDAFRSYTFIPRSPVEIFETRQFLSALAGQTAKASKTKPRFFTQIDGDFLVGDGTTVSMTLDKSGYLDVPPGGQFQVLPSSVWLSCTSLMMVTVFRSKRQTLSSEPPPSG